MRNRTYGFTIIELLIVVVVIGILASVSIVAYSGIQNRANDTVIKNDLANFARKIQLIQATTGEYPSGGATDTPAYTGSWIYFPDVTFRPTKNAYFTQSGNNLMYCTGLSSGKPMFRLIARSKSGETFLYSSAGGLEALGQYAISGSDSFCGPINYPRTWAGGYYAPENSWMDWTN